MLRSFDSEALTTPIVGPVAAAPVVADPFVVDPVVGASVDIEAGGRAPASNRGYVIGQLCVLTSGLLVVAGASLLALHVA